MTKSLDKDEEKIDLEDLESLQPIVVLNTPSEPSQSETRMVSLYGEVDEEKSADLCCSLLYLKDSGLEEHLEDPENPDSKIITTCAPIKFVISTYGGSALEMFSVYDVIRYVREECEIHTYGIGKVMSAGALLLAAGTKGERMIGKNCRVMLHSVIGASHGALHNLENEMEEIRVLQEQHIDCLVEETKMTKRYLKKLLNRKINIYLTAEESVKLGIADKVI